MKMVLEEEKKWYEYDTNERVKKVYTKYTLKQFWDWWTDKQKQTMEVRIKTSFSDIKDYSINNYIPMSKSGLYVDSFDKFYNVIKHFRQNNVIWFGVNPKRKLVNKQGYKKYSGLDINISEIKYLFIDIDRIKKEGIATKEDLMSADILSNYLLEELGKAGFNKNYCKICSGNGVQLLFKLDMPFNIPYPKFDKKLGEYIEDEFFDKVKNVFRNGIKSILQNYSNSFRDKFNVEIDTTCFNMGRVGALPFTYNFKHNKSIPRGIIELVEKGENTGISDYLKQLSDDLGFKEEKRKEFDKKTDIIITSDYEIKKDEMYRNSIVDLMMNYRFPMGGINNTLWFALKILFHRNKINKTDKEYVTIRERLKKLHERGFSDNGLETKYSDNYNGPIKEKHLGMVPFMVNKYLRLNKIERITDNKIGFHKPLFDLSPNGKSMKKLKVNISNTDISKKSKWDYNLSEQLIDPLSDVIEFAKHLDRVREGDFLEEGMTKSGNLTSFGRIYAKLHMDNLFLVFLRKFREKWKDEITCYMYKYYMEEYFNYKRF